MTSEHSTDDTCPSCGETVRFIGENGPYCRACGWRADDKPRLVTDGGTIEKDTENEVLYLTKIGCHSCEEATEIAHRGPPVPLDQDPPLPDVNYCPKCGEEYPHDLGVYVWEVHEAEVYDPTTRGRALNSETAQED